MEETKPRHTLELFMEQGTEGAHWCVYDNNYEGYDGLISLYRGDYLQILDNKGVIIWEGIIEPDYNSYRKYRRNIQELLDEGVNIRKILSNYGYDTRELSNEECKEVLNSNFSSPYAGGYKCHWTQKGVDPDIWAIWFESELEAKLEAKVL